MKYEIKRNNAVVLSLDLEGRQIRRAMGEDLLDVSFKSKNALELKKGDTIEAFGLTYKLNRPEEPTRRNGMYEYVAQFEAPWYDLIDVQFRGLGANSELTEAEFSIKAKAYDIVDLVVRNANRVQGGWTIGIVDETDFYNFTFSGQNCKQVLNELTEVFGSELWFDNKTIHFQKRETVTNVSLSVGKGNGLYELRRGNRSDASVVTRLYVEGGSRNLPIGYGRTRLQLPDGKIYLEKSGADKIIEATQIFDNIIPERVGTVTSVGDMFTFSDSSMDFDVNDNLMDIPAKIGFQTGSLAGYEFELNSYNATSKTFKILLNDNEKAYPEGLPNESLKPAVGDEYVIFDIELPQSYIDDASARLESAGQAYLDKYSEDQYEYYASLTPIFVRDENPAIDLGYRIHIADEALNIDKHIRIAGYSRDLQNIYSYELELADELSVAEIVRQYAQQEKILYAIQTAGLLDPEQMRKNLFLNKLSENDGYLIIGNRKVKAGLADEADHALEADHAVEADNAELWNGLAQPDYLTQPVRPIDSPTWQGVNVPGKLTIPQSTSSEGNALSKGGSYLMLGPNKAWAGRADLWNGLEQPDYLTQPVRPMDSPIFAGVNSASFASGFAGHGYRIKEDAEGNYSLEVDSLTVRKEFNVFELIANQIRATNGSLWVSDAIKITGATKSGSTWICSIDTDEGTIGVPFISNDIVRCQRFNGKSMKYYTARVTSVNSGAGTFNITLLEGGGEPASGDDIVRIGNTSNANRQGALYLTASDNGAPYMDVVDGVTSASLAGKTRVRLGRLDGIVDADLGALSGYGLYGGNAFLTGVFHVRNGSNVYTKGETDGAVGQAKNEAFADATTKVNNAIDVANDFSKGLVDGLSIGGKNLIPISKIVTVGATLEDWKFTLNKDGASNPYIRFPFSLLKPNQDYTFSFKVKKISGEVAVIAGHAEGITANQTKIYRDGVLIQDGRAWSGGDTDFPDDEEEHTYVVTTRTHNNPTAGNGSWYIQPNRNAYGPNYALEIWDVQVEEGHKATPWSPAYEDLIGQIDTLRTETLTEFSVLDGKIESKVSQTDFNGLNQRVGQAETSITQTQNEIEQKASKQELEVVEGLIQDQEVYVQYSSDGQNWHTTFQQATDKFMRQRKGNGAWTAPIRLVGIDGEDGKGIEIAGSFPTYSGLPTNLGPSDAGKAYMVLADGKLYIWDGSAFPPSGQGIEFRGPKGDVGGQTYIWVKYADNAQGGGMSDNSEGKSYIGLAFNKTEPTGSNNPSDYEWSELPQNVEIGGRNYLFDSRNPNLFNGNNNAVYPVTKGVEDGVNWISGVHLEDNTFFISCYSNPTYAAGEGTSYSKDFYPYEGEPVTYSLDVMCTEPVKVSLWTSSASHQELVSNKWTRITWTTQGAETRPLALQARESRGDIPVGTRIYYKNYKIEKGTKATDWSPAPEDIDQAISTITVRVTDAETDIIQNANAIALRATKAEVTTIQNTLTGEINTIDSRLEQAELKVEPGAIRATVQAQTEQIAKEAVDALKLGGRNLLLKSDTVNENGNYNIAKYSLTEEPKAGEIYTITIWGELAPTKNNFRAYNTGGNVSLGILLPQGDGIYQRSFEWRDGGNTEVWIYVFNNNQSGVSRIDKIQLEKGDKPTDWSPAPEDLYGAIGTLRTETFAELSILDDKIETKVSESEFNLLGERVGSAETTIQQHSNSIALKADSSTVTALGTRVSSAEAKITPEAINLTVKGQTETIAKEASAEMLAQGEMLRRDPTFKDGNNGVSAYPSSTGTTISRLSPDSTSPTGRSYRYTATGYANAERLTFAGMSTPTRANAVFVAKIVAKIPVGWQIRDVHNASGNGRKLEWLTPVLGTGDWETYIFRMKCGEGGTFSTVNFFDLRKISSSTPNPSSANPVISYLAYATVFDLTGVDDTPTVDEIKSSFSMTENSISLLGQSINMTGKVTFSSLKSGSDGQSIIEGGKFKTSLIKAEEIFAQNVTATGDIKAQNLTITGTSKIASFSVDGDFLRTSGYGSVSGVRISDIGIASRNAGESALPPSVGLDMTGSFVGTVNIDVPAGQTNNYARAGIVGFNLKSRSTNINEAVARAFNVGYGHYGAVFSSYKNVGAVHHNGKIFEGGSSGIATLNEHDYLAVINTPFSTVRLPANPDQGRVIIVKNVRSVDITIQGNGNNILPSNTNTATSSVIKSPGRSSTFQFHKEIFTSGFWVEIAVSD